MKLKTKSITRTVALAAALTLAAALPCAAQTTWTVTSTADDSSAGTLRAVLNDPALEDGDTINITATGTIDVDSAAGPFIVNKGVTIVGPGQDQLTVDGQQEICVFEVEVPWDKTVTISGLTIANGATDTYGGGVLSSGVSINNCGTLTLTDCTLRGNSAVLGGGGVCSYGPLTLTGCTLSGNSAGGTIYDVGGGAVALVSVPGIYNTLTIENSDLSNNTAPIGGGIAISVTGGNGGGAGSDEFDAEATVNVSNSTLSGNSAADIGGAMAIAVGGDSTPVSDSFVTMENCTLRGNSAANDNGSAMGGAIANYPADGCPSLVSLNNCTLSDNSAGSGGTIANLADPDNPGYPEVVLKNTILANDSSTDVMLVDEPGETTGDTTIVSTGHNLCTDGGGGFLTAEGDQINTDPMLGPLQDNGGPTPTWTCALLPGSPAIDAADSTGIPTLIGFDSNGNPVAFDSNYNQIPIDSPGSPVTTDQRGISRPQGPANDIGAFELEQSALTISEATVSSPSPHSPNITVTVTITDPSTTDTDYNVTVTSANLGGIDSNSSLPLLYGAIKPGASKQSTLHFKNVPSGDQTLTITGTSSLGAFFTTQTVTVP